MVAVGIQDPGNLGGLLRTAEAAGATGAYLTAGTADPFSWKALRGSMGSAFRLPHVRGLPADEVLRRLRARGVAVLATAAHGVVPYDRADLRGPCRPRCSAAKAAGLPDELVRGADQASVHPHARPRGEPERGGGRRHPALRGRAPAAVIGWPMEDAPPRTRT